MFQHAKPTVDTDNTIDLLKKLIELDQEELFVSLRDMDSK